MINFCQQKFPYVPWKTISAMVDSHPHHSEIMKASGRDYRRQNVDLPVRCFDVSKYHLTDHSCNLFSLKCYQYLGNVMPYALICY